MKQIFSVLLLAIICLPALMAVSTTEVVFEDYKLYLNFTNTTLYLKDNHGNSKSFGLTPVRTTTWEFSDYKINVSSSTLPQTGLHFNSTCKPVLTSYSNCSVHMPNISMSCVCPKSVCNSSAAELELIRSIDKKLNPPVETESASSDDLAKLIKDNYLVIFIVVGIIILYFGYNAWQGKKKDRVKESPFGGQGHSSVPIYRRRTEYPGPRPESPDQFIERELRRPQETVREDFVDDLMPPKPKMPEVKSPPRKDQVVQRESRIRQMLSEDE